MALFFFTGSVAVVNSFFYFFIKNKYKNDFTKVEKRKNKVFIRQSIILSIIGVLPYIKMNIDKILIADYIDYESLGVFSVGIIMGKTINGFFKNFFTTINAKLVNKALNIHHYLSVFVIGSLIGCFIAFIVLPKVIVFFYGEPYQDSIIFSQIMVCSLGLFFFKTIYYNYSFFNRKKSIKVVYLNNVIVPTISILLMFFILSNTGSENMKLISLALLYPIDYLLTIMTIYILSSFRQ